MNWLSRVAADEQFWATAAQVEAALVIALALEGRGGRLDGLDHRDLLTEVRIACESLLGSLIDKYSQGTATLAEAQLRLSSSMSPREALQTTESAVLEIGLP